MEPAHLRRIQDFSDGVVPTQTGGALTYCLATYFPKTAWKLRKLNPALIINISFFNFTLHSFCLQTAYLTQLSIPATAFAVKKALNSTEFVKSDPKPGSIEDVPDKYKALVQENIPLYEKLREYRLHPIGESE